MKSKDICRTYQLDPASFDAWIKNSGVSYKTTVMGGLDVDDSQDVAALVGRYQAQLADELRAEVEANAARRAEEAVKQAALSSMLITSGFNFDGFTITKYSGYISGDDAVQIDRGRNGWFTRVTNVGDSLLSALVQIRRNALIELKEAAYALGCNAVIGVDFDYLVLDPETVGSNGGTLYLPYVFGVTANGNAVVIERNGAPNAPATPPAFAEVAAVAAATPLQEVIPEVAVAQPFQDVAQSAMPASWQADPTGESRLRWWDGTGWTEHTQD